MLICWVITEPVGLGVCMGSPWVQPPFYFLPSHVCGRGVYSESTSRGGLLVEVHGSFGRGPPANENDSKAHSQIIHDWTWGGGGGGTSSFSKRVRDSGDVVLSPETQTAWSCRKPGPGEAPSRYRYSLDPELQLNLPRSPFVYKLRCRRQG